MDPKSVDDSQWSKWKQAHTVEVKVTTVYDYKKDGTLKITETYSGEKLKGKFKVDKLTRSQTFSVPDEEKVAVSAESGNLKLKPGDKKEIVTQESIVLTTADDPYKWWISISSTALQLLLQLFLQPLHQLLLQLFLQPLHQLL